MGENPRTQREAKIKTVHPRVLDQVRACVRDFLFFIIIATKGVFDARSQRKVLKNTPFAHIPPPAPSHRKQENKPKKPTLASQSGKSIKAWKINNKSPTSRTLIQLYVAFLRDVNRGSNTSNK